MKATNNIFSLTFKLICLLVKINDVAMFSYVTIPFYYGKENEINSSISSVSPKNYYEQMLNLSTYTNINVNDKLIKFHLTFDRFATYISEKDYNETCSDKEKEEEILYSLDYIGISLASYKKNIFHFLLNGTTDISINNYSLFVVKSMKTATDYEIMRHGYATKKNEIGLNVIKGGKYDQIEVGGYMSSLYNNLISSKNLEKSDMKYIIKNGGYNIEEKTNLINQLKTSDIISSYAFTIKIDKINDLKGSIIIGGYPHELDSKHYNEKFFIYDIVDIKYSYYYWNYIFKDIYYGKQKLEWAKNVEFSLEFPFILSVWNYLKYLDEKFFKNEKYTKYCGEEKLGEYYIKYCSKDVIKKFETIYFYLSNKYIKENQTDYIEFNYKDLFVKSPFNDNIYLFQMIFADNSYKWIFGKPLFKKYTTVFDQDKRIFGFYTETGEYNNDNNEVNKSNNFKNWFYLIIIFASIFFIFCIILIVFFFKKFPFNKRKKKANELDDEYEYNSNNIDKKQNDLLIND